MLVTSSPSYRLCHYRRELSILPLQKRRPVYTPTLASSSQPTANTPCPWRASPWVRPSATLTKQCYLPWIDLVLITFSRGNIIATSIFSRTVVFISTFSSIKMELTVSQKQTQDGKKSSLAYNMFSDCMGHPSYKMLKIKIWHWRNKKESLFSR